MTRHVDVSMLPSNATPIETALSLVSAEHRDLIPWDDLAAVFDPARCPERLLPWLATVFSVDVWFEAWSVQRKRDVIAQSIQLHRMKGTLGGIEAYLALVDTAVVKATTPPALFYLSDFDDETYKTWLSSLQEVRIYHWTTTGVAVSPGVVGHDPEDLPEETEVDYEPVELFLSDIDDVEDETVDIQFCLQVEEPFSISGLRAVLIQDGQEVDLGIETENETGARDGVVSDVERLFFPETAGAGLYLQSDDEDAEVGFLDSEFLHDGSDRRYVAYVRRSRRRVSEIGSPSIRGREVTDDDPERVFLDRGDPGTWFLDDANDQWFLADDYDILSSYYDSWRIVDPAQGEVGPGYSFLDHDRFRMPAYTAELLVDIPETAPIDQWFLDYGPIGYSLESDFSALWNVCDVTVVAKSKRDEVLLDLDVERRRTLRQTYSFKDLKLR